MPFFVCLFAAGGKRIKTHSPISTPTFASKKPSNVAPSIITARSANSAWAIPTKFATTMAGARAAARGRATASVAATRATRATLATSAHRDSTSPTGMTTKCCARRVTPLVRDPALVRVPPTAKIAIKAGKWSRAKGATTSTSAFAATFAGKIINFASITRAATSA